MEQVPNYGYHIDITIKACMAAMIPVGFMVTVCATVPAIIFPICYMFYAQQTALGIMYMTTGGLSLLVAFSNTSPNYQIRCAVALVFNVMSWIMTIYVIQVAMNYITQSFFRDRSLEKTECPYSGSSADETLYLIFGSISMVLAVAFEVLSVITFVVLWRLRPQVQPQYPMAAYATPSNVQYQSQQRVVYQSPVGGNNSQGANAPPAQSINHQQEQTPRERPYSIVSFTRNTRKMCLASNIADLKAKGKEKLGLLQKSEVHIFRDDTGAEVEDNDILQRLPENVVLMFCDQDNNERWTKEQNSKDGATNAAFQDI